jgi:thioredoxin-dependent peroxiredoxin
MSALSIGDNAPDFWLPTDDGLSVTPTGIKGKSIILYFYPKDDTSGCTAEAIAFSGLQKQFEEAGALVIGVSKDTIASHKKFRQKHNLSIVLASDFENQISEAFGVWVEKSMYGRKYMGLERATFLINPDGIITHIWRKVKVAGHGDAVLEAVQKSAS